jgi:hypothetical protein
MFLYYAMFSFGVSLDPRGYRVFEIYGLKRFSRDAAAPGEGFAGKREFEVLRQV